MWRAMSAPSTRRLCSPCPRWQMRHQLTATSSSTAARHHSGQPTRRTSSQGRAYACGYGHSLSLWRTCLHPSPVVASPYRSERHSLPYWRTIACEFPRYRFCRMRHDTPINKGPSMSWESIDEGWGRRAADFAYLIENVHWREYQYLL